MARSVYPHHRSRAAAPSRSSRTALEDAIAKPNGYDLLSLDDIA
jgi:hypothetical protein